MMRTHRCGELRAAHDGETVTLCGWVHHRRDHGKVVFLDLRDASGVVQVVFPPAQAAAAADLQREFCVRITGAVKRRKDGTENAAIPTGEVEVQASEAEILAPSATPPFVIEDGIDADEALRLKYRYLDLRRPEMQRAIRLRAQVVREIRRYLDENGFTEIETPILFKSTPEGARDFLVPSRLQPGSFYALPQSPQMLKQLLMVSGFDRYYQIAKCFRDEDARADRQLEFTQLDLEMSFAEQEDVLRLTEGLFVHLWRECLGVELEQPFPRLAYDEALRRFGHDYVDLRFGMELHDLEDVFTNTTLTIFRKVVENDGVIRGFAVPGGAELHHNELRKLEHQAMERGAKGLAWIKINSDGSVDSPLAKHLSADEVSALQRTLACGPGDAILMVADAREVANPILGQLRMQIARDRGLIPSGVYKLCWVLDYPYFEWNAEAGRWEPSHHPFTAPLGGPDVLDQDPATVRSSSYDLVCNGTELASGSIRIHHPELQQKVFDALGISPEEAEARFGFFLEAFRYGPPPHGGIAPGIDRIVMKMLDIDNVREVVAFPKTKSGSDAMSGAPTPVDPEQLKVLGIKTVPQ